MQFAVLGSKEFAKKFQGRKGYIGAIAVDEHNELFDLYVSRIPEEVQTIFVEFSLEYNKYHKFINQHNNIFKKYNLELFEKDNLNILESFLKIKNDFKKVLEWTNGFTSRYDVNGLIILILKHIKQNKLKNVKALEVGSWTGTSSYFIAKSINSFSKNNKLFCVDTWGIEDSGNSPKGEYTEYIDGLYLFKNLMKGLGTLEYIRPMAMYSQEAYDILKDNSFDVAFIDGNHDYDYVFHDIINTVKKINLGGIIIGHDYRHHNGRENLLPPDDFIEENKNNSGVMYKGRKYWPGVMKAVDEVFGKEVGFIPNANIWFKKITETDKKRAENLLKC